MARLGGTATEPTGAADHPLVSVVMPAYNASAYIRQAIDSVLAQDYPAVELIVVDDGSTDDTVARVQAYGDRVRLLTQANQGSGAARNQGLEAARGEYIAFLDSDDVWLPGKLTAQVAYLERHPDVDLVYSRWQTWRPEPDGHFAPPERVLGENDTGAGAADADGDIPLVAERSGWLYNQLLFGSFLHTITVMARRRLIEAVGPFDPALKRGQDYDYWLRASRHTEIHKLDRIHALYRLHGAGCITHWPDVNYEHRVLKKALERWGVEGPDGTRSDWRAVRRRLAATCFDFGYHHYWQGQPRRAASAFRQALGHHPLHLGSLRYLSMSLVRSIRRSA
ncbi:glycosyltransferase [Alkalilimnicola ehrlichii]|uniref:glycosyltransferase n=1 Tax=Alkalilimnicola ehrlichii TaxID=351052 RepID=UPI003B9E2795